MTDQSKSQNEQKNQQTLNAYLHEIEKALANVSVVDRSDILMELHSHITESVERNNLPIETVIDGLGKPHEVANRYLLSRGIQPVPYKRSKSLRNFFLVVTAVIALFFVSIVLFVKSLFPIIEVDEQNKKVKFLGGLIDINDKGGEFNGSFKFQTDDLSYEFKDFSDSVKIKGTLPIESAKNFRAEGQNGSLQFETSNDSKIHYKCRYAGEGLKRAQMPNDNVLDEILVKDEKKIEFNFKPSVTKISCRFKVPRKMDIDGYLVNGHVRLNQIDQPAKIEVLNGKIKFDPDSAVKYNLLTDIKRGVTSGKNNIESTPKGHKVDLRVSNGMIRVN